MLATTLTVLFAVELIVFCGLFALFSDLSPAAIVAAGLATAFIVRALIMVATFVIAFYHRTPRPPSMTIGPLHTVRMVVAEIGATYLLYYVTQPLKRWFDPKDRTQPPPDVEQAPVLLIHGFFCNGAYWWSARRYLRRRGISQVFTIDLEPLFASIDSFAEQVARRVDEILRETGADRVILVGHSMGGLVSRVYVHQHRAADRVAAIVTLGSPHHGTELAHLVGGTDVAQMRPGNPWLAALNALGQPPAPVAITCIYSCHDNIIAPQASAALSYAQNVPITGVGHQMLGFDRSVLERLYRVLVSAGQPTSRAERPNRRASVS